MKCRKHLGPSPDWVVGVNGLNLCLKNCTWIEKLNVDLYPYDSGTDSGITYMVFILNLITVLEILKCFISSHQMRKLYRKNECIE